MNKRKPGKMNIDPIAYLGQEKGGENRQNPLHGESVRGEISFASVACF